MKVIELSQNIKENCDITKLSINKGKLMCVLLQNIFVHYLPRGLESIGRRSWKNGFGPYGHKHSIRYVIVVILCLHHNLHTVKNCTVYLLWIVVGVKVNPTQPNSSLQMHYKFLFTRSLQLHETLKVTYENLHGF